MTTDTNQDVQNRQYYDEFAAGYEKRRGENLPNGYHDMLDELEASFVERFGRKKKVLEVGCGTGLVLTRIAQFAAVAHGLDLSPRMLEKAKARGLAVTEGSAISLPFEDESFDVTCSFKVLAHVIEIEKALSEMARVTKKGGVILAEFYNPWSFRGLLRLLGPARKVGQTKAEGDVFTRFDNPRKIARMAPAGCVLESARGIRILTPVSQVVEMKGIGPAVRHAEERLSETFLRNFAGFYVAAYRKL